MLGIASLNTTAVVGACTDAEPRDLHGGLFFMVGMLYTAAHPAISEFGGLKAVMPWFSAIFLLISLSSIAVPASTVRGEFLILLGRGPSAGPWSRWPRWG